MPPQDEDTAQDFRALFPAAVMLPLACAFAHSLICVLDNGYVILAVTYIPANIFLALARTAVHRYVRIQQAPTIFANIWAGLHVLGTIPGILSAIGFAEAKTVPVGGPVIVGCFAALWGVVCTVEGPVLKLPLRHRLLGHASVLAAHCSAPPMSELGQPSEALILAATLVMGDLYGTVVEAGLNVVRARAFVAGQQDERKRLASLQTRRVLWRDEDPTTSPQGLMERAAHSGGQSSCMGANQEISMAKTQRVALLNAMISESRSVAALALSSQGHGGSNATSFAAPLCSPFSVPASGASMVEVAADGVAQDSIARTLTWVEDWWRILSGHTSGAMVADETDLDEAAFTAFQSRRMLPAHLLGGAAVPVLLAMAPDNAFYMSQGGCFRMSIVVVLMLGMRITCHCLLTSQMSAKLSCRLCFVTILVILAWLGSFPRATVEVTTPMSRGVLACTVFYICWSMHMHALPMSWRAILVAVSAIYVSPKWPALHSADRLSIWMVMHIVTFVISYTITQYHRQCFQKEALGILRMASPAASFTKRHSSVPAPGSVLAGVPHPDGSPDKHSVLALAEAGGPAVAAAATPLAPLPGPFGQRGINLMPTTLPAVPPSSSGISPGCSTSTAASQSIGHASLALETTALPARTPIPSILPPPSMQPTQVSTASVSIPSATHSPTNLKAPASKPKPMSLGVVALKPHALGKLPDMPPPLATAGGAAAEGRDGLGHSQQWHQEFRLHIMMFMIRTVQFCVAANSLYGMPTPLLVVAFRLCLQRMKRIDVAYKLFQWFMVAETWMAVGISIAFPLRDRHEALICDGLQNVAIYITECSRRSTLARCAFLGWQIIYPFLTFSTVKQWHFRVLITLPRSLHMTYMSMSNDNSNVLEPLLYVCMLGSGFLAFYIKHLTEELRRQNTIRMENVKLRSQLHASLHTVNESQEHIAELRRLVGASGGERKVLDSAFDDERLPKKILERRIAITELEVEPGQGLGQGCFGQVRAAVWRGRKVACKEMHRSRLNEHDIAVTLRSAQLQLSLHLHPNIVQLYGMAWSCENARIVQVMELCSGGTLAAALESNHSNGDSGGNALGWLSHKLPIAAGLAQGLAFLHEQLPPIIHRDIKPDNGIWPSKAHLVDTPSPFSVGRRCCPLALLPPVLLPSPALFYAMHSALIRRPAFGKDCRPGLVPRAVVG